MIDHLELKTANLDTACRFYAAVLEPLGYLLTVDGTAKGFGDSRGLDFFLVEGLAVSEPHFAFRAPNRQTVDACYAAVEGTDGKFDRPPALAPHIHPNYYAAYLRDPDDRLVEFVCHEPE